MPEEAVVKYINTVNNYIEKTTTNCADGGSDKK